MLVEEPQKDQEKAAEAVLKKMVELEKDFDKGDSSSDQGMQHIGGKGQDTDEVQGGGGSEQNPVRDNP